MSVPIDVPDGTILTVVDKTDLAAFIGAIAVVDNDIPNRYGSEEGIYIPVRWLYGHAGQSDGRYLPRSFDVLQEASAIYEVENFNLTGAVVGRDCVRFLDTLPDGTVAYGEKEPEIPFIKEGLWHSVNDSVDGGYIFAGYNEFVVIAHVPNEAVSYA